MTISNDEETARLRDALESILRCGLETLSCSVNDPDDRDFQRAAVAAMARRARLALEGAHNLLH